MENSKDKRTLPKRIGELLVAANVVRADKLLEGLRVSQATKSPIGRTLMSMGQLTEQDLQAAIELQALLRSGLISTEFGINALNVAVKNRVSLQQAFVKLGWHPPAPDALVTSELSELILEAGIVTPRLLDQAINHSKEHDIPLGRCLVVNKAINSSMLGSVLTAQVLLRDGKINKDQAVAGLKASMAKQQSFEQSLKESDAYCHNELTNVRLGELLTAAGLITENDKISAIEMGLQESKPIGQILVEASIIPPTVLNDCLKLQTMIADQSLTLKQAVNILKEARAREVSIDKIWQEQKDKESQIKTANHLMDFFLAANLLTAQQVNAAQNVTAVTGSSIGQVLLESGLLNDEILNSTTQAKNLVDDNIISIDQAIASLSYCFQNGVDFHRALQEAPWDFNETKSQTSLPIDAEQKNSWLADILSKLRAKE